MRNLILRCQLLGTEDRPTAVENAVMLSPIPVTCITTTLYASVSRTLAKVNASMRS